MIYLQKALYFILSMAFGVCIWTLLLRLAVAAAGVSFFHPISQFLLRVTEWLIRPTKKIKLLRPRWRIDWAIVLWLCILSWLSVLVLTTVATGLMPPMISAWLPAIAGLAQRVLILMLYSLLFRALLSWVARPNPLLNDLLVAITEPYLRHIRRRIPSPADYDLSMLWGILLLVFVNYVFW